MKQRLLLAAILFVSSFLMHGQSGPSMRSSVSYTPKTEGYQVSNIPIVFGFRNCYGEVVMAMNFDRSQASVGSYLFEGTWYSPSEIGSAYRSDFKIDINDLEADLYQGSYRLGHVRIDNLVGFTSTGCFGETYDLLGQLGLNNEEKKWKEGINELSLRNIRLVSASSVDYKVHDAIRKIQKDKEFQDLRSQAQAAEASEDWETAKGLYQKASYISESEAMQAKAKEMSEKISAERVVKKAESLAKEAESLAADEQFEAAAGKYEAAARVDESKQSDYQAKADEMRQKQTEKDTAEEESAAAESSEEEDSANEGSEEESEDEDNSSSEESAYDEEARAKSAAMEEYERQERVNQYWENRNQATQDNMMAAGEMGAQAILVHLLIGRLIYNNMDSDVPLSTMAGPGDMIGGRVGYSLSSVPIFTNSESETYDGNNFGTSNSTDNYQSFILELGGGFDYWPIYSERFGLGASVDLYAGHGLLFQQFSYGGALDLHGYFGGPGMQIYVGYRGGLRNIYHEPWIDPGEFGSGKAETSFSRITAGPQFRFINNQGSDFSTLGVLGVLERNYAWNGNGGAAALFHYSPGIRLEWNKRNRFSLGAEAVFNYRRVGERLYGYDPEATFNGSMYNINFHRRFDRFYNSALRMRNPSLAYQKIREFEGFYLSVMQPNLTWIQSDTSGYRSTEPFIGIDVIGFHYFFKLHKGIGIGTGVDGTYSGVRWDAPDIQTYSRMHRAGISIPLTMRFHLPKALARYYAEMGYSYHYFFYNSLESRNPSEIDGYWSSDDENDLPLLNAYGNYRFAIGMGIPGRENSTSIGLVFERSLGSIIDPDYSSDKILPSGGSDARLNRLTIQFAVQF
tara:strand:+ start:160371 stop:162929 length:2559 start_codon:yes stop_codon:yes gene_type:complete